MICGNRGVLGTSPLLDTLGRAGFWVLGCSDPLSVRSVAFWLPLAAELQTSPLPRPPLRHGFHFRVTVVFRCVSLRSLHRRAISYTAVILPAAYSKSPNTLYLFLVFAEYTPILLPIYNVNIVFVNMSGTVSGSMAEVLRSVTLCNT